MAIFSLCLGVFMSSYGILPFYLHIFFLKGRQSYSIKGPPNSNMEYSFVCNEPISKYSKVARVTIWTHLCRVEGNGSPLQYSCLENPIDVGAWWAAVHGVSKSLTRLSNFTFMHWRRKWQPTPVSLPGESRGRRSLLGSMGSQRVGHDWSDLAAAAAAGYVQYITAQKTDILSLA